MTPFSGWQRELSTEMKISHDSRLSVSQKPEHCSSPRALSLILHTSHGYTIYRISLCNTPIAVQISWITTLD